MNVDLDALEKLLNEGFTLTLREQRGLLRLARGACPAVNRCDGCRIGLAFNYDGRYHVYPTGGIHSACTRERYVGVSPDTHSPTEEKS